jgi:ectoine hydroxylase-related dioxygenase (phytanoyl-CoA dioxygenase family)
MKDLSKILKEDTGYYVLESFISKTLLEDFKAILKDLYPVRASSSKKVYAEGEDIKSLEDISVWWSQTVDKFEPVQKIKGMLDDIIITNFPNLQFYASDTVTINPHSNWISPHVDTPHRFPLWNFDKRLLGIQCIISLQDADKNSAATGLVPFSQKRDFDIMKCYTGFYDNWFKENVRQPNMPEGSLLMYNCRVLHSSMPNPQNSARPALLFNYLDNSIVDAVSNIDNIWSSNGKRP